nr:PREDICTED: proline-rich protein 2-like isoform X1 [Apteryx mantelli mantelli]XP_013815989.1 PREDICTED: proline-rich protein 2-like isoform X2 [Apteryx mantelli mantelli]
METLPGGAWDSARQDQDACGARDAGETLRQGLSPRTGDTWTHGAWREQLCWGGGIPQVPQGSLSPYCCVFPPGLGTLILHPTISIPMFKPPSPRAAPRTCPHPIAPPQQLPKCLCPISLPQQAGSQALGPPVISLLHVCSHPSPAHKQLPAPLLGSSPPNTCLLCLRHPPCPPRAACLVPPFSRAELGLVLGQTLPGPGCSHGEDQGCCHREEAPRAPTCPSAGEPRGTPALGPAWPLPACVQCDMPGGGPTQVPPLSVGYRALEPAFGQRLDCLRDAGTPVASEAIAVLLATGFYSGRGGPGAGLSLQPGQHVCGAGQEPLPRAPLQAEAPALYIFLLL